MARIRSLKPEMKDSESFNRLSREARLLLVLLITQVDDEGRIRASSRGLASLLYPFDDDVPALIEGWLKELEREKIFIRYVVDGSTYGHLPNFTKHQKIDHASKSKLPAPCVDSPVPREASRILAPDQGSRIKDQGGDQGGDAEPRAALPPAPAGHNEITDEPQPVQVIREHRTFGDFQAVHPKVFIGRDERDAWVALLGRYGWDPMHEAYEKSIPLLTERNHRVQLSMVTKYLDEHFQVTP